MHAGRNLPHFSLGQMRSLTLCDLSLPMLERAEEKFHEELRLAERHPKVGAVVLPPLVLMLMCSAVFRCTSGFASATPTASQRRLVAATQF